MKKKMKNISICLREVVIDHFCIRNKKNVKALKKRIKEDSNEKIKNKKIWKGAFSKYINIGTPTSLDVCEKFYTIKMERIKKIDIDLKKEEPILICMVKNDLARIKMIIEYYRKLGIKLFAILDDYSTDGTREYLINQKDIEVYNTDMPYTTNIRQARINRIIDYYGFDRWYLVIDSDELFTYTNIENITISEYIKNLQSECVKSVMVDMYSKGELFSKEQNYDEIEQQYQYYDNDYYYNVNLKGKFVHGGARSRIFMNKNTPMKFTASKITLVHMKKGMILSNSHCIFPYKYNFEDATTVLRHYKFLKSDIDRYIERIENKNFANGSLEYQSYINAYKKDNGLELYNENSQIWKNSYDVDKIIKNIKVKNEKI